MRAPGPLVSDLDQYIYPHLSQNRLSEGGFFVGFAAILIKPLDNFPAKVEAASLCKVYKLTLIAGADAALAKKRYNDAVEKPTNIIGQLGENIAANYLKKNGYKITAMNFANELGYRRGELDIIAKDPQTKEIVFVEVKARAMGNISTNPIQAITPKKYQKLSKIIASYINRNKLQGKAYRLDAIAIEIDAISKTARLRHFRHIYY